MALDNKTSILDLVNTTSEVSEIINTAITDKTLGIANTNLSNITSNAKKASIHNVMPSSSYIDLVFAANGASYTAPDDGYIWFRSDNRPDETMRYCYYFGQGTGCGSATNAGTAQTDIMFYTPVSKDTVFYLYHNLPTKIGTDEVRMFRFYYCEGNKPNN